MIKHKKDSASGCRLGARPFLSLVREHQHTLLWISLYLLLFASSLRFDAVMGFVTTTIAIFWMIALEQMVRHVLIPRLLVHHRQTTYYTVSFLLVCIVVWIMTRLDVIFLTRLQDLGYLRLPEPRPQENNMIYPVFKNMVLMLGTFTVTTVSYLLSQAQVAAREKERLYNEKIDMELRYLKAQINPHFLFNALNNIYSLVLSGDPNGPESILRLSEMLRYVTDECQTDLIALSKEIKYTENYIDFQLMRMEGEPAVSFEHRIANPALRVPPMLFQPFVENCFKHSRLEHNRDGYIRILIEQDENQLRFTAENSKSSCIFNKQSERGGVGIANVRKRLDLAYGSAYSLEIADNERTYRTTLTINLKQ